MFIRVSSIQNTAVLDLATMIEHSGPLRKPHVSVLSHVINHTIHDPRNPEENVVFSWFYYRNLGKYFEQKISLLHPSEITSVCV